MPILARLLLLIVHLVVITILYAAWLVMLAGWLASWLVMAAHCETSAALSRTPLLPVVSLRLAPVGGAR